MIWALVFVPVIALITLIITLIPAMPSVAYDLSQLINFIRLGMYFTDASIFATVVSTFITVELSYLSWNIIKFIYSKIPFLNIR